MYEHLSNTNIKQVVFDCILPTFCDPIQHNGESYMKALKHNEFQLSPFFTYFTDGTHSDFKSFGT